MPPGPTAPRSLAGLLAAFRPCFTAPTFQTFIGLVVGLIAQTRRRTVCGMLTGAGLDQVWHHSRAHRMFSCRQPVLAAASSPPRPESPAPEPVDGRNKRRPVLGDLISEYEPLPETAGHAPWPGSGAR